MKLTATNNYILHNLRGYLLGAETLSNSEYKRSDKCKQIRLKAVMWRQTVFVRDGMHSITFILILEYFSLLGQEEVSIYNLKYIDRFYIHLIGLKIRVYVYVVDRSHSHFQESDISILSEKLFISRHIQGICTLIYIKKVHKHFINLSVSIL